MKKIQYISLLFFVGFIINAQEKDKKDHSSEMTKIDTLNHKWVTDFNGTLHITESTFTNWASGGENSFGVHLGVSGDANKYYKDGYLWLNSLEAHFSQTARQGEYPQVNSDHLNLNSIFGKHLKKKWFVDVEGSFSTQFAEGYQKHDFPTIQFRTLNSAFLSPATLKLSAGVLFNPMKYNLTNTHNNLFYFTVNPAAVNMVFVADKRLRNQGFHGLNEIGDSFVAHFGGSVSGNYNVKLCKNLRMNNGLNFFTQYNTFDNMSVSLTSHIYYTINKYFSASATLIGKYVPNAEDNIQFHQTLGIGLNYQYLSKK